MERHTPALRSTSPVDRGSVVLGVHNLGAGSRRRESQRASAGYIGLVTRQHLCQTFRAGASSVFDSYQRGRSTGLVPWETSFTDFLLLSIATAHPREVIAHRFDGRSEATTGADWEWWFRTPTGIEGLRVQAKRRNPRTGDYGIRKSVHNQLQVDLLIQRAVARGVEPFYCLYGDRVASGPDSTATPGPCPHGPFDPTLWGASLVPAGVVATRVRRGGRRQPDLLGDGRPWHILVCPGYREALDTQQVVREFINSSRARALARLSGPEETQEREVLIDLFYGQEDFIGGVPADVSAAFTTGNPTLLEPVDGLAGVLLVGVLRSEDG